MSLNIILAAAAAAATIVSFANQPYYKSVILPENTSKNGQLVYINLDEEIYRRGNVSSILITSESEPARQLPFILEEQFTTTPGESRNYQNCKILDFKELSNNEAELTVENIHLQSVDILQINHHSKDFYKKVSIWGSDDQKNWQAIINAAAWYDYSSKVDLSQRAFSFPQPSRAKYFKLRIANYQETEAAPSFITSSGAQGEELTREYRQRAVKIDSVSLGEKKIIPVKMFSEKKFELKKLSEKEEDKFSKYTFESNCTPIEVLTMQAAGTFSRKAKIYGGNDLTQLELILEKDFSQIAAGNPADMIQFRFVPRNFKYYCIEIFNGDNQPLENVKIQAAGKIERLVLHNPPPRLHVYYGGAKNPAKFDLSQTLPQLNRNALNVISADLKAEERNPEYIVDSDAKKWDFAPYVKYVIISVIIILLLIIIVALFRKIDFKSDQE